jgi:alpha-methylacyl-CoA racemase
VTSSDHYEQDLSAAKNTEGPLSGVRVVEISAKGAGPYAALLLAEYGADVVRIARPGRRDPAKAKFATLERSRPLVELDVKNEADRGKLVSLIREADVFIEGFRPGVMERLGIGPDECFGWNPRIVYARMTGWGQSGPLAQKAGHDLNFLAMSGALSTFGAKDREPAIPLNLVADFAGGSLFLVIGILLGLRVAQATGKGQVVDAAMLDGVASLMTATAGIRAPGDWVDERASNFLDGGAPFYRTYRTSDDRYVAVGAIEPEFWIRFLNTLGVTDAIGEQWDRAQWPSIAERLAKMFATRTRDEWTNIFAEVDCCFTPVLSLPEASSLPHAKERGIYDTAGGFPQPRSAPVLIKNAIHRYSAREGASTSDEVLARWKRRDEMETLRRAHEMTLLDD